MYNKRGKILNEVCFNGEETRLTYYLAYSWSVQWKWEKWAKPFVFFASKWREKDMLTKHVLNSFTIARVCSASGENSNKSHYMDIH